MHQYCIIIIRQFECGMGCTFHTFKWSHEHNAHVPVPSMQSCNYYAIIRPRPRMRRAGYSTHRSCHRLPLEKALGVLDERN